MHKKAPNIFDPIAKRRRWRRMVRWIKRFTIRLIAFLFLLVILLWFLLQDSRVQNWATQKAAAYLSQELKTKVSVDRLDFDFFDKLVLDGVYIEDLKGDTLLYSRRIKANLKTNLISLLNRKIEVTNLSLEQTRINLVRDSGEVNNNLQALLDNIFPKRHERNKPQKPFFLDAEWIHLSDVKFVQSDMLWGKYLEIAIDTGSIEVNQLSIPDKLIAIKAVHLHHPQVQIKEFPNNLPDDYVEGTAPGESSPSAQLVNQAGNEEDTLRKRYFLSIDEFRLSDGRFSLNNYRNSPVKTTPDNILDYQHLQVFDITVNIDSFQLMEGEYMGQVNQIAFQDLSGFVLEKLSAREAKINNRRVELNDVQLLTPYSDLGDTLVFKYRQFSDFKEFNEKVLIETHFHDSRIAIRDIMVFAPPLEQNAFFKKNKNEVLKLNGEFRGRVNNLRGRNLDIVLADSTTIRGDFSSRNLAVKNEEFLNLKLDRLKTDVQTLRLLVPGFDPPQTFDKLGKLDFSGRFDGFFVDFVANGALKTDLGRAKMDMRLDLKNGREKARYSGGLTLIDFDLAKWSGNDNFGKVSFSSQVKDGLGLTLETVNAKVDAQIEALSFRGYTYDNLTMEGVLNKNLFDGKLLIADDNIDFAFQGSIEIKDSVPYFDFDAQVHKIDFQALNLSKENYMAGGQLHFRLNGKNLSNMQGLASATEIEILHNDTTVYLIDSLVVKANKNGGGRQLLEIESEVLEAEFDGFFDLQQLPKAVGSYIKRNYPAIAKELNIAEEDSTLITHQFDFKVKIKDTKDLLELVNPKFDTLKGIVATGYFDNIRDSLQLDLEIPTLGYDKFSFDDIVLILDGRQDKSRIELDVYHTSISNKTHFAPLSLYGLMSLDTINFNIRATNFSKVLDNLNLNGRFTFMEDFFQISFLPSNLVILNERWDIKENNYLRFRKDYIETNNFKLTNDDQLIQLVSKGEKGLKFRLDNLDIAFVNDLWTYDKLNFGGMIEIEAEVSDAFDLKDFGATIKIDTFLVNNDDWGKLEVVAKMQNLKERVLSSLSIVRGDRALKALGFYVPPTEASRQPEALYSPNHFQYKVEIVNYPINIAEYFIGNAISNTVGQFDANIQLTGPPAKPNISGDLLFRDGAVTVDYLQTRYFFDDQKVQVTNTLFDASDGIITDSLGNRAYVTGGISHNHLKDLGLDAFISSPRFLFLNTRREDNELYYGTGIGGGSVSFSGSFQQANIDIDAVTGRGTHISIPINYDQSISGDSFIRFVNKNGELNEEDEEGFTALRGVNLSMKLQVTDAAEMQLIFDEQQGDIIRGRGNGNLQLNVNRSGDISMYGDYIISEGGYLFTLREYGINKKFVVKPGGTIRWSGDPYDARINLEAQYDLLRTSPYLFIQDVVEVRDGLAVEARRPTLVYLNMKLEGSLLKPDIKFDIEFPNLSGELKGYVENQLRIVQQDINELNRQVFGLIVLGSFLPSGENALSRQDLLTGSINTISEMVSNQLSLLVTEIFSSYLREGGVISGLNVDASFNLYESATDINNLSGYEWQFRPKVYLWDDRISIDAGLVSGNINGENYTTADVAFDVKLTEDGRWKFYVYNRPELDITGRSNKTGAGIRYRREFDSIKELFGKKKRK